MTSERKDVVLGDVREEEEEEEEEEDAPRTKLQLSRLGTTKVDAATTAAAVAPFVVVVVEERNAAPLTLFIAAITNVCPQEDSDDVNDDVNVWKS